MKEIYISCKSCGRKYLLGKDAAVVTSLGVMADFRQVTVFGDGSSFVDNRNNPDLVASFEGKRNSLEPSIMRSQQAEITRISSLLSTGTPRWWKCRACGTIQTYQPSKVPPKRPEEKTTNTAKQRQVIEVEADSLEEAREQVELQMQEGSRLISEKIISDGKQRSIRGTADTIESAFEKVQNKLPPLSTVIDKKVRVNPARQVVVVEAFDENTGRSIVKQKNSKSARVEKLVLKTMGSKGFLGMGKRPNSYEAQIVQPAVIEITYREKAKIRATIGEKTSPSPLKNSERRGQINRVEICFDSRLPGSDSERKAVEDLVKYFDLPKSFTRDVDISTSYGKVPGVTLSLKAGDCTDELQSFAIARAVILGMGKKEIIIRAFTIAGTLGVLIAGYK